jgi:hypothetical protein
MTDFDPGRPTGDEHIPYYEQYIRLVPDGDVLDVLARQIQETAVFLASLTPERARWRPASGEWDAIEIVGHLADTERVFGYRALKIARADPIPWESYEPNDYVAAANFSRRPLADVTAEFVAVRAATVAFLRGLDEAAWRQRMPDAWTNRSVRAIAYVLAGHELHHLKDLRSDAWGR